MNPFEMVVAIVSIVMIASVIKSRNQARHGIVVDRNGNEKSVVSDQDTIRMKQEIAQLQQRIAVLERITTETNSAITLDREIEKLR